MDGGGRGVCSFSLAMSAEKRWRLVCYDIRSPERWRKVFKLVRGAGESVQYSVFRCRLDDRETEKLKWQLAQVMEPEDSLLVIDLCSKCATNVVTRNHVAGWAVKPPTFRIIGGDSQQAPTDGESTIADSLSQASDNLDKDDH